MLTVEELGITTTLPDFCKGCHVNALVLDETTFYANSEMYVRNKNITCRFVDVCTELYERLKEDK